ncbi:MAG: hypothetical protein V1874_15065 [Spirochaetota bacterium]
MQPACHNNYSIAIKTSCGKSLGMGHIQRMSSLLWFLNEQKKIKTALIADSIPEHFPAELKRYIKPDFDFIPELIIRDMRDSYAEEITRLKKISKVLVIDDNGPGRKNADIAIDILPNPDTAGKNFNAGIFIYGYNFLKAVNSLNNKLIKKETDFSVYPGNSADTEYINFLISLLPEDSAFAVLNGRNSFITNKNKKTAINDSPEAYANIILSSKSLISHFGITLYEGFASGCRIFTVNPGKYHSHLADMAKEHLRLVNLGEYNSLDIEKARLLIKENISKPLCTEINAGDVYKKIISGLDNFCGLLLNLMQKT